MAEPWGDSRDGHWYVPRRRALSQLAAALEAQGDRSRAVIESHDLSEIGQPGLDGAAPTRPTLERILFHLLQEYAVTWATSTSSPSWSTDRSASSARSGAQQLPCQVPACARLLFVVYEGATAQHDHADYQQCDGQNLADEGQRGVVQPFSGRAPPRACWRPRGRQSSDQAARRRANRLGRRSRPGTWLRRPREAAHRETSSRTRPTALARDVC